MDGHSNQGEPPELSGGELVVPAVNIASRQRVGHFVSRTGFARYLDAYRAAAPAFAAQFDVPTGLGAVRAYRYDGPADRTPVLLLPGRGSGSPMWRTNLASLVAQRTVFSLDLLGDAGLSVQSGPIADAADQARWLDEVIAGLGLARVHLLGVSMGGWLAVNAAVRTPDRIASIMVLDPAMTFGRIPAKAVIASIALVVPRFPGGLRRRVMSWLAGGPPVDETLPEAELLDAAATGFVVRQPAPRVFADDALRALSLPVLAIIAGRSVIHHPARAADRARRLLATGQVELWPDASHAVSGEFPDRIAERSRRFFGDVELR
ncbi:alpha/beta fold hydrolase [Mycolicibacterium frederiksbergense]|uniref:alpha/beta fold hydrolase n=1 Tax=Mycolicibacterium frederiksbergense TaxID=117567 RepID=UPI00265C60CD|nr:alpha/beta hydrolase [Mycolicibacterium frederiksbergense]MDO0972594.1 alpha/beta hydrolase [Mycolicibacterium frederiksbergense]